MEDLAAFAAEVAAGEDERFVERDRTKVVDLHVTGHGKDVEWAVELAHSLVEQGSDDTAVDVAGRALVHAVKLKVGCGDGIGGVAGVGRKDKMEALRVCGAAAEAMAGTLVDGRGGSVHGDGSVAGCVGGGH